MSEFSDLLEKLEKLKDLSLIKKEEIIVETKPSTEIKTSQSEEKFFKFEEEKVEETNKKNKTKIKKASFMM